MNKKPQPSPYDESHDDRKFIITAIVCLAVYSIEPFLKIENLCIAIIVAHFCGDFILQNRWMLKNKFKNTFALFAHVVVYALWMYTLFGLKFAVLNGLTHLVIDCGSSKLIHSVYIKEEEYWAFALVGAEQALHITLLLVTAFLITF